MGMLDSIGGVSTSYGGDDDYSVPEVETPAVGPAPEPAPEAPEAAPEPEVQVADGFDAGEAAPAYTPTEVAAADEAAPADEVAAVDDAPAVQAEAGVGPAAADTFEDAPVAKAPVNLTGITPVTSGAAKPPDTRYDGMLVGGNGQVYGAGTPVSDIPPYQPDASSRAPRNNETIIYTNGILTDLQTQQASLQAIANATGSNVIGVHNSTEGAIKDLLQCLNDKSNDAFARNPAVDSLQDTIHSQLLQGNDVHLIGHSQGGLVTSRALSDLKARLTSEDGMTTEQAERLMSRIKVETFGAAASSYPDGPQYTHNINRLDVVPTTVGLGEFAGISPFAHPGRGAKVNYFTDWAGGLVANHSFDNTYLNHRVAP